MLSKQDMEYLVERSIYDFIYWDCYNDYGKNGIIDSVDKAMENDEYEIQSEINKLFSQNPSMHKKAMDEFMGVADEIANSFEDSSYGIDYEDEDIEGRIEESLQESVAANFYRNIWPKKGVKSFHSDVPFYSPATLFYEDYLYEWFENDFYPELLGQIYAHHYSVNVNLYFALTGYGDASESWYMPLWDKEIVGKVIEDDESWVDKIVDFLDGEPFLGLWLTHNNDFIISDPECVEHTDGRWYIEPKKREE